MFLSGPDSCNVADDSRLAGDAPHGWKTGYVLALFIVGFFLLAAFLYWQSIATNPLMPLWVWRDRNFSLVCLFILLLEYLSNLSSLWELFASVSWDSPPSPSISRSISRRSSI